MRARRDDDGVYTILGLARSNSAFYVVILSLTMNQQSDQDVLN